MGTAGQSICLWTAPVVGAFWLICFLAVPGLTAPLSPTLPAAAVAAFYADPDHLDRTRYGMILFNWFGIGFLPFYGLITVQMKRMAHNSEVLAWHWKHNRQIELWSMPIFYQIFTITYFVLARTSCGPVHRATQSAGDHA